MTWCKVDFMVGFDVSSVEIGRTMWHVVEVYAV